jgi:hypothetical protein
MSKKVSTTTTFMSFSQIYIKGWEFLKHLLREAISCGRKKGERIRYQKLKLDFQSSAKVESSRS